MGRVLRTLAGLLALCVAAPSARAAGEDVEALVRVLVGEDQTERYDAYRALLASRPPEALPLLAKALPGAPLIAQNYGVSLVAGYPAAQTKAVHEKWAAGDAPYLKVVGAVALLRAGNAKAAATVAEVIARDDLPPDVMSFCLGQVSGLKDAAVLEAVRGHVRPEEPTGTLGSALWHLANAGDEPSKKLADRLLGSPSAGVRAMAAAFLLRLGDEARAAELAAALGADDLPYDAFSRVYSLLSAGTRLPAPVLDALLGLLEREPQGWSLTLVVDLLGDAGYAKAAPALRKLLERDDTLLSKAAFTALTRIPGGLTPDVVKSLLTGGDDARRVAAAEALRRGDDLAGLPAVLEVLAKGKTSIVRAEAARVLAGFRVRASVEPLLDALSDPDVSVRAAAVTTLESTLRVLYPYRRIDLDAAGYASGKSPEANAEALRRVRAWWASAKDAEW